MAGEITFSVRWSNDIASLIEKAALKAPYAVARAVDEVGNKAATQLRRATAAQAGVPYGKVVGVTSIKQAMGAGGGSFIITARDVTLSLKEFGPRRTGKGISAAPWKRRLVFKSTFIGPNGHVYVRRGKSRLPIKKLFGPNIPKEMVKDQAEQVFYTVTAQLLPFTLEKWLLR